MTNPIASGVARTASLVACRRLQAYGQRVTAEKLKSLREQGVLAKTVDSIMAEMQRTNRSKETLTLTTKAGASCSAVPGQGMWQQLVQAELRHLPRMGVGIAPLNRQTAAAAGVSDTLGLLVQSVAPGSGAQAAGLVPRDVIVSIDGKPGYAIAQLREVSAPWKNGDKVNVEVARKGGTHQKLSVEVKATP